MRNRILSYWYKIVYFFFLILKMPHDAAKCFLCVEKEEAIGSDEVALTSHYNTQKSQSI